MSARRRDMFKKGLSETEMKDKRMDRANVARSKRREAKCVELKSKSIYSVLFCCLCLSVASFSLPSAKAQCIQFLYWDAT